jgi:multicomponent Na+:H+ antiporter subunit B
MNEFLDLFILACLMVTAVAIIRVSNLFAVVVLAGFYSLLMASMFVVLDAVDVAFTEAAVGAGISTLIFLGTLLLTTRQAKPNRASPLALAACVATGSLLIYGTQDMPAFGDPQAPIHQHVAPRYINQSNDEIGVPNIVTSVLASYRGYDTMGEVVVILTAGIGVLLLLYRGYLPEKEDR